MVSSCQIRPRVFFSKLYLSHIHPPELLGAEDLRLHIPLEVDENRGQILVRIVGDAGRGYALQKLDVGEFGRHGGHVLVD